ncbi:MAG: 2-hydroxyacid dehydrogenase [Patescibacteria group bacterium UBA2163]
MANVFVTREIPDEGLTLLKESGHSVTISQKDGPLTADELIKVLQDAEYDAVLSTLNNAYTAEVMDAAPSVKIIANYAVGFNNIDIDAARERGITVTNTPGVLTDAVAEHTMALVFSLARRVVEADRFTRAGKYIGWAPKLLLGTQVKDKTLGIVGAGRIGSRVAEIATAMGIHVIYNDIKQNNAFEEACGAAFVPELNELLNRSDIVSLHVPLLDATHHLINAERLKHMKKDALLINTARGPVVDEKALVEALKNGSLQGAALDVFEEEPALTPGLVELENVILTPHIASATIEARQAMSRLAGQSIIDFFAGKTPTHVVT